MKNLIWQFHKDAKRKRDSENSLQWASCSIELATRYALKHEVEYAYSSKPRFWGTFPGAGPGFERFQLFDETFDSYDYVLYLDTDILLSSDAPNIFKEYSGCDIASFNWPNKNDLQLFENGWLANEGINIEYYKQRYVSGGFYLMSRALRQTLRKPILKTLYTANSIGIEVPQKYDQFSKLWPCGDQSMLTYLLCKYNFSLRFVEHKFSRGPFGYNCCGAKDSESLSTYFDIYNQYRNSFESVVPHSSLASK